MDTDTGTAEKKDNLDVVVAAIGELRQATAAAVAAQAGCAYSTITPKLRALEDAGRAERVRASGKVLWRLTTPAVREDTAAEDSDAATTPAAAHEDDAQESATDGSGDAPEQEGDEDGHDQADTDPEDHPMGGADPEARAALDDAPGTTGAEADGEPDPEPAPGEDTQDGPAGAVPEGDDARPDSPVTLPETPHLSSDPVAGEPAEQPNGEAPGAPRRRKGALRDAVLKVLQDHPDDAYKVGELSKLLGGASAGAIANALHKLVTDGSAKQTVEKPATYQAV